MNTVAVAVARRPRWARPGHARPLRTWLIPSQARLRGAWLDRELAAGIEPWRTPVHCARSLQITGTRARRSQARALERLIERAGTPAPLTTSPATLTAHLLSAQLPVDSAAVIGTRRQLEAIAIRLRDGRPVSTRAVAALRDLLSDGAGPIYSPLSGASLPHVLECIGASLNVPD